MPSRQLLHSLDQRKIPKSSGNKAKNLHRLLRHNRLVPKTFTCTTDAYQRYINNDLTVIEDLRAELTKVIQPDKTYAIRSSANVEDSLDRSYAGQFKSELNIGTIDDAIHAIKSVWSSTNSSNVRSYLETDSVLAEQLLMGVIIQEMVHPLYSGVALSKNPVTGTDEVIVEAVMGQGDQLVQEGATPYRWINKWGTWLEKPSEEKIPISLVEQVVNETRTIADTLGFPIDLEWVYDGKDLFWVQVREISGLNRQDIFSNHISREFIPGMIKPLVYSVNIPLVNSVWIEWISEVVGDLRIKPTELARSFFYRVYFNMGVLGKIFSSLGFPSESVEMLMGTLPPGSSRPSFRPTLKTFSRLPRMLIFVIDKWRFGPKMKRAIQKFGTRIKGIEFRDLEGFSAPELLAKIDVHFALIKEIAYYNVLGPLLMGLYNNILSRMLKREGVDFKDFDLTEDMTGVQEHDPSIDLERLHKIFLTLPAEIQEQLKATPFVESTKFPEAEEFFVGFNQLLQKFGHLSDSGNDFSTIPWRENPDLVMELITSFESVQESQDQKIRLTDLTLKGLSKPLLKFFYRRAREFRLLREDVSQLYTHGYGLFRYYYLAIGKIFVEQGVLSDPKDIFFLADQEIRKLVSGMELDEDAMDIVQRHKRDMEKYQHIALPKVIFGDQLPPLENLSHEVLRGVAASGGTYKGRVRVVSGLVDIRKITTGDVLVVPYSDVSWTPLFRQAGAVISESGGLLSHSAIVAREYNIPAVVNVNNATQLLDDTLVTVDGYQGKVFVH